MPDNINADNAVLVLITNNIYDALRKVLDKFRLEDTIPNRKTLAVILADIGFAFLYTVDDVEEVSQRINGVAEAHIDYLKEQEKSK